MKTKHNWVNVPKWAQYQAVDEDGDLYAYEKKPMLSGSFWLFDNGVECSRIGKADPTDWENSLEQRPPLDDTRAHIEAIIKNVLQDEDTDCGNEILCSVIAERCAKQILKALNLCE